MQSISEQFDTNEAAAYLRFKPATLRNARHTGRLAGVTAPPYKKLGSTVRYERQALDEWFAQFKEQTNTGAAA